MSLVSQIQTLAQRIAQEFKAVRTEMSAISGGTALGVPTYLQQTEPSGPAIWYKTDASGNVIDIRKVT